MARAVAVDWSGAAAPRTQRDTIWTATAVDGELVSLVSGLTRDEAVASLARVGAETVIGLDFCFSFPASFLDGRDPWDLCAALGDAWLATCPPPFWGRRGHRRSCEGLRRTELAHAGTRSVFQIGGAGSVGTASIRGMPYLPMLRAAGMAVWPFDAWPADGRPVVAEVWPRSFIGSVVKSSADARARFWGARPFADLVCASPDAFDAACAAVGLSLADPPTVTLDAIDRVEGRIFS